MAARLGLTLLNTTRLQFREHVRFFNTLLPGAFASGRINNRIFDVNNHHSQFQVDKRSLFLGNANLNVKADVELLNFLNDEIASEKKAMKGVNLPTQLDNFDVKTDQSEVTLTSRYNDEKITIILNVNHTVDSDDSEDEGRAEKSETSELKSRPNFDIEITKGNQTLSFSCSYIKDMMTDQQDPEYHDSFTIDEVCIYEGENEDEVYRVAGDILDGYLYDLFMNMLEERGMGNEFAEKLSTYCTDYEQSLYIKLLTKLQNFVKPSA